VQTLLKTLGILTVRFSILLTMQGNFSFCIRDIERRTKMRTNAGKCAESPTIHVGW
jgi:hypothetical protein